MSGEPRRERDFDPLGRAALFLPPQSSGPVTGPVATGRAALFSAPRRRGRTPLVECARCGARTPVPLASLPARLLASLWVPLPGRRHTRFMRCPACTRPAWCRVAVRA